MTAQETVYKAIEARGYIGDWTKEELVFRHLLKLIEETSELAESVITPPDIYHFFPWKKLYQAAERSRVLFDNGDKGTWEGLEVYREGLRKELADVVVVCLSLAEVIGFDVVEAAVQKATADVSRGARGKQ